MNWQKLFSYGEVVCFCSAWAVGLLMALSSDRSADERTSTSFASATDVPGVQATLYRLETTADRSQRSGPRSR
jgi:hypothetical protein